MTIQKQAFSFLIVGGVNTLFGYALYSLLIYLGMDYVFATLVSTCFGVLFNFKTTGKFVFKNANNKAFMRFLIVRIIIYFFNISLIKFISLFTSDLYLAGFISIFPASALAFVLSKYMVFHKEYATA